VAIWILPRRLDHPLALLARSALQGQMVRRRREDRAAQRAPAHLYHLSDQADRPALQSSQRVLSKKRAQLLSPYAYLVPSPLFSRLKSSQWQPSRISIPASKANEKHRQGAAGLRSGSQAPAAKQADNPAAHARA
jgi:hypothetical protein